MSSADILATDLPPRLLDRGRRHQRVRPRRGHGRRQDQHREHRRHHRDRVGARPRHHLPPAHPADAGDRPGADRRVRRRHATPSGQVNLLELVALDADKAAATVEHVNGAPVYRLRGHSAAPGPPREGARCRVRPQRRSRADRGAAGRGQALRPGRRPGAVDRGHRRQAARRPAQGAQHLLRRHDPGRRPGGPDPRRPGAGPARTQHRRPRARHRAGRRRAGGGRARAAASSLASAAAVASPSRCRR